MISNMILIEIIKNYINLNNGNLQILQKYGRKFLGIWPNPQSP